MTEPLVDVLIPAYNSAATLRSAVESILNQTVQDIRVVVVNDGSTDDTPQILQDLASSDARVYPLTRSNGGIVEARNSGLEACSARYFACLDADDLAYPDRFAKQIAYLEANADCVAVGAWARHIDQSGTVMGSVAQLRDPTSADPKWVPSREPYIVHSSLMTYTKAVKDLGGYRHAAYAEDTDLFWRLQQVGRLHILPETLVDYRVHAESISSTSPLNGRVSAAFSQLTGIGALRRRQQKPDLEFQQNDLARYKQAGTLLGIYNLAKQGLDDDEADYLEAAVAAKMLELVSYRPYELDIEDCYFIRRATNLWFPKLEPANKREVKRSWTGTAAQMALKRKWREAFALVPPRLYPEVGGRILFHLLFSKELKASVRSWLRTARKRDTKI